MYVVGIDAHSRYLILVVLNRNGAVELKPRRVLAGDSERLLETLAEFRPLEAVVETSSSWPWLHEVLSGAGITFVLAHAKRLRAIAEANYKTDEFDAELLARMQLAGLIPRVYPTPASQREWATLLRHRQVLVRQRTSLINRIHAQLHNQGLSTRRGHLLTAAGKQWLRDVAWLRLSVEQRRLVKTHLRMIAGLRPLIGALDRRIRLVAAEIPEARLLQTIPGIAAHRALLICAEALPIERFRTAAHLVSYAGLAPQSRQSGTPVVRHGSIPAGANRWLRGTLVRAVVTHVRCQEESWLTKYYLDQKARLGWPVARVAAARKLARAIHGMLRAKARWSNAVPESPMCRIGESSTYRMPLQTANL